MVGISRINKAILVENEMFELLEEMRKHTVYHIQDWQELIHIPGGTEQKRVHFIFDETSGNALFKDLLGKIQIFSNGEKNKRLTSIIKHPIRSAKKGIFPRRIQQDIEPSSPLFNLLLIINDRKDLVFDDSQIGREKSVEALVYSVVSTK